MESFLFLLNKTFPVFLSTKQFTSDTIYFTFQSLRSTSSPDCKLSEMVKSIKYQYQLFPCFKISNLHLVRQIGTGTCFCRTTTRKLELQFQKHKTIPPTSPMDKATNTEPHPASISPVWEEQSLISALVANISPKHNQMTHTILVDLTAACRY